jgi:hypothetical protein
VLPFLKTQLFISAIFFIIYPINHFVFNILFRDIDFISHFYFPAALSLIFVYVYRARGILSLFISNFILISIFNDNNMTYNLQFASIYSFISYFCFLMCEIFYKNSRFKKRYGSDLTVLVTSFLFLLTQSITYYIITYGLYLEFRSGFMLFFQIFTGHLVSYIFFYYVLRFIGEEILIYIENNN